MRVNCARVVLLAAVALLAIAHGGTAAESDRQVQVTHEGRLLNGWITETDDSPVTVLMLHGTLAHANMEIMATLADVFAEYGVETLRVTLSLGLDDRHGMFDCAAVHRHAHADALGELAAWVSWLQENGRQSILLLGHSRATNQVTRYAASAGEAQPLGLVLVAPGVWSHEAVAARFARQSEGALPPLLARAEAMIESGQGEEVIGPVPFLHCKDATVIARSFAAYYRDDPLFDTFALIDDIDLPVIVLSGTEDPLVEGLNEALAGLRNTTSLVHVSIDGADHFFRDLYAYDVVEAAQAWLAGLDLK
ncbi:MAG: alpha/beta hydrolase [Gammaproteobacteria bacterium]|nr:alpha/beta hydrolase [Gammaproteobacteria bacterium]